MYNVFSNFDRASQLLTSHDILYSSVSRESPRPKAFVLGSKYKVRRQPAGGLEQ
jgi:hypothetical protein